MSRLLLATLLVALLAAGCSTAPTSSAPVASGGPDSTGSSGTAVPGASAPTGGFANPIPDGFAFGAGDVDLFDPSVGLAELVSYRASLAESFSGTIDGQATEWSMSRTQTLTRSPVASSLIVQVTGDTAPDIARERWLVGGREYTRTEGKSCGGSAAPSSSEPDLDLATRLGSVIGAVEAGSESVDGVASNHATLDAAALGLGDTAQASGAVWVAVVGGFVTRWHLTVTADEAYFGADIVGSWTSTYQLTDVNSVAAIELPADCPPQLVDAPTIGGATDIVSAPGVLTYQTTSSLSEVLAFYEREATRRGWTESHAAQVTAAAVVLEYESSDGAITVFAAAGDGHTRVSVILD